MQNTNAYEYVRSMIDLIERSLQTLDLENGCALLDFPDIRNVGDSAIWVGEMAYLKRRGVRPAYVCSIENYSPAELLKHSPTGPLLLHGGGNFGDVWPGHQRFRERVLADFPNREVVQLPQSIHFDSDEAVRKAAASIAAHGNFKLFVRDRESQEFARNRLDCDATLCPDMAFSIGSIEPIGSPTVPILAMLREDKEASGQHAELPMDIPIEDWIEESPNPVWKARRIGQLRSITKMNRAEIRLGGFEAVAQQRFDRGRKQLSKAQRVITDRLHVHIVSLLMNKPHAVLDNSYGKIGRFRAAFPEPPGLSLGVSSIREALDWALQENAA